MSSWFFLSSVNGHDRCLQCLGIQHTEAAFVDGSCFYCERMTMKTLRSHLSFLKRKGADPSATTFPGFSATSRGMPASALGDLSVTVRASPHGPLTPLAALVLCGSRVILLGRLSAVPAFHPVLRRRIRCQWQHQGMGYHPLRMKIWRGSPPRMLSPPPNRTQS